MINAFFHWLNVEYWTASWPNIFAPSVWTLLGLAAHHVSIKNMHERHHNEQMGRV